MLTALTNIRSTMVLWYVEDDFSVEDDLQWKTTSKQARRLRFGMLTTLKNIRSTKVLHHASCIMPLLSKVGG